MEEIKTRSNIITLRVSDKEKEVLDNWARRNHLGLAPCIRQLILKEIEGEGRNS